MKRNGKPQTAVVVPNGAECAQRSSLPTRTKRLFTVKEAGTYLGFHSGWPVRELAWKGELPYVRLSLRRIAFDIEDLNRFIEARKIRECVH